MTQNKKLELLFCMFDDEIRDAEGMLRTAGLKQDIAFYEGVLNALFWGQVKLTGFVNAPEILSRQPPMREHWRDQKDWPLLPPARSLSLAPLRLKTRGGRDAQKKNC